MKSFAFAALLAVTQAADTNAWKQRAVYQVLTDRFSKDTQGGSACSDLSQYCGGTWKGIQNNLDYIEGMGFDAIWISPIVKNIEPGYHGYWASNWEEVNEHNGTEQDLKNLVDAAHARGIYVMVDVVANHSGPIGTDYSQIYPLNKAEHYHSRCQITNWSDQGNVEYCRLADLPDLNQDGNSWVRQYLKDWVKGIVQKYDFDGIRIDTIPEVPKDFWSEYGQSAGVFQMGECFNGDPAYVGPYQGHVTGLFNYPMYYTILDVFGSGQSMNKIQNRYNAEQSHFQDLHALGVFVDNHDNARFLHSHSNHANFTAAIIFSLTSQGIPFVYYGSEQYYGGGNDPQNRESLWQDMNTSSDLYQKIGAVNAARKAHKIWEQEHVQRYSDDHFYAFSRGEFLVALTNSTNQQHRTVTYQPFPNGTHVCNIFYPTTDCQTVNGSVDVYLNNGESKIYVPSNSAAFKEAVEFLQ